MPAVTTLRSPRALADAGLIEAGRAQGLAPVAARYAVAVTPALAALIDPADRGDPIARQFLPSLDELIPTPGELADPIGDAAHSPVLGIVHRYPDRVLLKVTHACAVYCRFCFRREVVGPGGAGGLTAPELDAALDYIASAPGVWEVILTGGDPLVLSPRRLRDLLQRLAAIDHVKTIRIHTRVPVADPAAIDDEMIAVLRDAGRQPVWVAVHANHARELTVAARAACARLVGAGIPLISQTVLLAGINDDPKVLGELMRAFVESRIKPYYLHHPDLAPGTAHFRVGLRRGQEIVEALRGRLSGLCQPQYVLDIPGGHGKAPVGPSYVAETAGGHAVRDPFGGVHDYPAT